MRKALRRCTLRQAQGAPFDPLPPAPFPLLRGSSSGIPFGSSSGCTVRLRAARITSGLAGKAGHWRCWADGSGDPAGARGGGVVGDVCSHDPCCWRQIWRSAASALQGVAQRWRLPVSTLPQSQGLTGGKNHGIVSEAFPEALPARDVTIWWGYRGRSIDRQANHSGHFEEGRPRGRGLFDHRLASPQRPS